MISLTSRYFEGSVYLHPAFCVGVFIDVFSQAFAAVLNTPSDSNMYIERGVCYLEAKSGVAYRKIPCCPAT